MKTRHINTGKRERDTNVREIQLENVLSKTLYNSIHWLNMQRSFIAFNIALFTQLLYAVIRLHLVNLCRFLFGSEQFLVSVYKCTQLQQMWCFYQRPKSKYINQQTNAQMNAYESTKLHSTRIYQSKWCLRVLNTKRKYF